MIGLSPSETAFVENLVETGDAGLAATIAGTQPSLVRDPRIQSALVDYIRQMGAADAIYARQTLIELAKKADLDSVRLRAAQTLWERGLGKVPDQIDINITDHSLTRAALYAEIHTLITELGLPPTIEGQSTLVEPAVAQTVERPEPAAEPPRQQAGREVTGSNPVAGTYTPELPTKWQ